MKKQITKIAAIITLAIGFLTTDAAAQQQSIANDDSAPITSLTGIETAKGTFDPMSNMFYGNSFVLNSFDKSETQHLTISLDYSCALDCFYVPCQASSHLPVSGGSWSLVIYRDNVYAGTLYGRVAGGTIDVETDRDGEPSFRRTQLKLEATGGLGRFAFGRNTIISGVYEATTDARSTQTTGSIDLAFGLQRLFRRQ